MRFNTILLSAILAALVAAMSAVNALPNGNLFDIDSPLTKRAAGGGGITPYHCPCNKMGASDAAVCKKHSSNGKGQFSTAFYREDYPHKCAGRTRA